VRCFCARLLFADKTEEGRRIPDPPRSEATPEIRVLADLIRDLQAQVSTLNSQLSELRIEEQRTGEEARGLRRELDLAKAQMPPPANAAMNSSPAPVSQDTLHLPSRFAGDIRVHAGSKRAGSCRRSKKTSN